jgi:hypothetical protein
VCRQRWRVRCNCRNCRRMLGLHLREIAGGGGQVRRRRRLLHSSSRWRARLWHTSTYLSRCQHTSAYVSIRCAHAPSLPPSPQQAASAALAQHSSVFVSIRQHTSAFVSIRQHSSAFVSIRQHTPACRRRARMYVRSVSICTFVPVKHVAWYRAWRIIRRNKRMLTYADAS